MSGIVGNVGSKSGVIGTTELDYEEGTYSITDVSGGGLSLTVSSGTARYIKVGKLIFCTGLVTMPSTSDSNYARFSIPFTSRTDVANSVTGGLAYENSVGGGAVSMCVNSTNGVSIRVDGGGSKTNAEISGKIFRYSVTYYMA